MYMPLRNMVWVFGLLALTVLAACAPGEPAADFALTTFDGEEFRLSEQRGNIVVVNFWYPSCPPCRDEMPELQELHDAYADEGFRVVGVSVDDRGSLPTIEAFIGELGIDFPIYHDPSWEIVDSYSLLGLPGTFLVDRDGVVVRRWMGPFRPMEEDVQEDVRELLTAGAAG